MNGFKLVLVVLVAILVGAVIGYFIGIGKGSTPSPPTHVYHFQAQAGFGASGYCMVVPEEITVPKGSNAEVEIVNLTDEAISVTFTNQIAVTKGGPVQKTLDPKETMKVTLNTATSGNFSFQVMGLGNPTCFTILPTPKIVIP